jgi:hypothetical protein
VKFINQYEESVIQFRYNKGFDYVKDFATLQNLSKTDEELMNISDLENKAIFQEMLAEI